MANKPFPFSVCEECCTTGGGGGTVDLTGYVKEEEFNALSERVSDNEAETDKLAENTTAVTNTVNTFDERITNIETFTNKLPIVSSVDEMTDITKKYVNEQTGTIWEYGETTIDDTDKNLFIKEEVALNQNPDGTTRNGYFTTGFIPADVNKVEDLKFKVTVNGAVLQNGYPLIYKIQHYKADFTTVGGQMYMSGFQSPNTSEWYLGTNQTGTDHNGGLGTNYFQIAYFKLLIDVTDNSNVITMDNVPDLIITTNEPKVSVVSGWTDTGVIDVGGTVNVGDINVQLKKNTEAIENHESRIETVETAVRNVSDIPLIPSYWKAAVDAVKDKVMECQNEGGADAVQFVWVSDIHGTNDNNDTDYIGAIARYAMDKYNIPVTICSGDIMSQSSHHTEADVWAEYEKLNTILSPIKPDELLSVKGNHDGAWGAPVDGVYYLKNIGTKAVYNAVYRKGAKDKAKVYGKDGTYYYVDINGLRIYMLNSQTDGDSSNDADGNAIYNSQKNSVFGQDQLDWLCESLSNMPDDMNAIIVSHANIAQNDFSADGNLLAGIIDAYNNRTSCGESITVPFAYWGDNVEDRTYKDIYVDVDYSTAKGKILAYFHGHNHKDIIDTTTYSFPRIAITTAGGDIRDGVERVSGTATETALDIVTVTENKISLIRLGAGKNREVTI